MDRIIAIILPGFWLGLWQYAVFFGSWWVLILPARQFFDPHPINEAGLGYVAIGMLVCAAVMPVLLVDAALYTAALPMHWLKRIGLIILVSIGGSITLGMVYTCGFLYGADSRSSAALRWTWSAIYIAVVGLFLSAHSLVAVVKPRGFILP